MFTAAAIVTAINLEGLPISVLIQDFRPQVAQLSSVMAYIITFIFIRYIFHMGILSYALSV